MPEQEAVDLLDTALIELKGELGGAASDIQCSDQRILQTSAPLATTPADTPDRPQTSPTAGRRGGACLHVAGWKHETNTEAMVATDDVPAQAGRGDGRASHADSSSQLTDVDPRRTPVGWSARDLGAIDRAEWVRLAHELRRDLQYRHATLMAAGVAFRAFLAVFSTLVVASSALALAQPAGEIIYQTRRITLGLPASAREVLVTQVETIVRADQAELQITFAIALLLAVWVSASTLQGVMEALTAVNGAVERRSWLQRRVLALILTLGSLVFVVISLAAITGLPVVLGWFHLEAGSTALAITGEVIGLSLMMFSALLVIYHVGPAQPLPSWHWTWPGAAVATVAWVLGTEGFSRLVEQIGTYNFRYGTVTGIAVLLLWLLLTSWCVLFGAIVNVRLARRNAQHDSPIASVVGTAIDEASRAGKDPGSPTTDPINRDTDQATPTTSADPASPIRSDPARPGGTP